MAQLLVDAVIVTALLFILGGWACTAVSMPRHHAQVLATRLSRRASLAWRTAGWGLLGVALVPCVLEEGGLVGIVAWFGLLTVGAVCLAPLLTYRPRTVSVVALTAPLLAIPILAVGVLM